MGPAIDPLDNVYVSNNFTTVNDIPTAFSELYLGRGGVHHRHRRRLRHSPADSQPEFS